MASTQQLLLGEGAGGAEKVYVEDVFSTYLYTGTGATQTITNNIDLSTEGGLVWTKVRSTTGSNLLFDTVRGATVYLSSNTTTANTTSATTLTAFNTDGFSIGSNAGLNTNGATYASWTLRKQPKFFDVVTYTGTGTTQNIAHNLGSVPGCIIIKSTSNSSTNWIVYHRASNATPQNYFMYLNGTQAAGASTNAWNNTAPTSTQFTVGNYTAALAGNNTSGQTYVAYLFAHDAGGFGLTGTDNVISCGSYTGNGSSVGPTVTLGYEPQWILVKNATATVDTATYGNWYIYDTMRGIPTGGSDASLYPNLTTAESGLFGGTQLDITATGFFATDSSATNKSGDTYIYIAIRRGPMKVPTDATTVFAPVTYTGTGGSLTTTTGINQDSLLIKARALTYSALFTDRLRGVGGYWMNTASTDPENGANSTAVTALGNTSFTQGGGSLVGSSGQTYVGYGITRAPSFFDEVCWTGTGSYPLTVNHNLGVAPELIIIKSRTNSEAWWVYGPTISPNANWYQNYFRLNATDAVNSDTTSITTAPSSTAITFAGYYGASGAKYVMYLFATCAGVSKVGRYTGTGTTKQVDCGFAAGARFVMIKRTDALGSWFVWDSARGIVSGNDPYFLLNSAAPEVTSKDYVDTYAAGFEISSTAPTDINASGGTYIFLAIA